MAVRLTARVGTRVLHPALQLASGVAVVGSDAQCAFRLDDVTVSRRHLEVAMEERFATVRDLGSTNGTRLNGQRIKAPLTVDRHALLLLGDVELELLVDSDRWLFELGELESVSPPMIEALKSLQKAPGAVVLVGEPGTGRELAARAAGPKPFELIDCRRPPRSLPRAGTVYLQYLEALRPVMVQALGRHPTLKVMAASDQPTDVLDPLAAVTVRIPALRERPDDLPFLARRALRGHGRKTAGFSPSYGVLQRQRWPGNLPELLRSLDDAVALKTDGELQRELVAYWLSRFDSDVRKAAQEAQVDEVRLHKLIKQWQRP